MSEIKFTTQQHAAISARGGPVLVSAGAGSGKTRVLVERLMSYLTNESAPKDIDDFLIITYTRAAAAELRGRIIERLSEKISREPENRRLRRQTALCHRARIGTIHSFCADVLRENPEATGLPLNFRVMEEDALSVLKERSLEKVLDFAYERIDADEGIRLLVDTLGAGRDDSRLAGMILSLNGKMNSHPYPLNWAEAQISRINAASRQDAAQSVWAKVLIDRAVSAASFWADRLERLCLELGRGGCNGETLLTYYGPSLTETEAALRELLRRESEGWEGVRSALPIPFPAFRQLRGFEDKALQTKVKDIRDSCKSDMAGIAEDFSGGEDQLKRELGLTGPSMQALLRLALRFNEEYSKEKARKGFADFSDLEHGALALLSGKEKSEPTPLAGQYSRRFAEVMVDEYQDCNAVQDMIFTAVSDEGRKLFAVGDIKQSIYRFRLADPGIFNKKYKAFKDYESAGPGEGKRIPLQTNFRSRGEIINAVNAVFEDIMSEELGEVEYGDKARLELGAEYPGGSGGAEIHIVRIPEDEEDEERPAKEELEARFVSGRINELIKSGTPIYENGAARPVSYGDIVILMRSVKSAGAVFRRVLGEHGIPASTERDGSFFDAAEVCAVISLLKVIDNPRQDIPLISALRSPAFLFTADELAAVRTHGRDDDFYTALCKAASHIEKCAGFLNKLREFREASRDFGASKLIWKIYEETSLLARVSAMQGGEERRNNLILLAGYAQEFEKAGYKGINAFASYLNRLMEKGRAPAPSSGEGADAVRIMTIHKSKGLEFPIVFLSCSAKPFNKDDAKGAMLVHSALGLGQKITDTERGIEYPGLAHRAVSRRIIKETLSEEMRVLYVAMTRARERLIVTGAWKNPEDKLEKLSRETGFPIPALVLEKARSYSEWLVSAAVSNRGRSLFSIDIVNAGEGSQTGIKALRVRAESAEERDKARLEAQDCLSFHYLNAASCALPSKITATEMKGRLPDRDLSDESAHLTQFKSEVFRIPDFAAGKWAPTGAERGAAVHLVMQHIDLSKTGSRSGIEGEIKRLEAGGYLTGRQANATNAAEIEAFFRTAVGKRLRTASRYWRELRFSLLWPAAELFEGAGDEEILMQGVIDCCFEEEGALTVVDFKTDYVTNENFQEKARLYRSQVEVYAKALERMMNLPVKLAALYFFRLGETYEVQFSSKIDKNEKI